MPKIAPTQIVPPEDIMTANEIMEESWHLSRIGFALSDTKTSIEWLATRGLLENTRSCCNDSTGRPVPCSFIARSDRIDKMVWNCKVCRKKQSIRNGSFFQDSKLTLQQIIIIIYSWAYDMPQVNIKREADIGNEAVAAWANYCREACEEFLEKNPCRIGGKNVVVLIDHSYYFHRKYHRGQWEPGHWVFIGIEQESSKCFLVEVEDRTKDSLCEKILEWILPGSHILSDGWASYADIPSLGSGIYSHEVIEYDANFVDSKSTDENTQTVENLWMREKRKLSTQFETNRRLYASHLHEFVWRNTIKNEKEKLFNHFMILISAVYSF